jgi:hypothetical protein
VLHGHADEECWARRLDQSAAAGLEAIRNCSRQRINPVIGVPTPNVLEVRRRRGCDVKHPPCGFTLCARGSTQLGLVVGGCGSSGAEDGVPDSDVAWVSIHIDLDKLCTRIDISRFYDHVCHSKGARLANLSDLKNWAGVFLIVPIRGTIGANAGPRFALYNRVWWYVESAADAIDTVREVNLPRRQCFSV